MVTAIVCKTLTIRISFLPSRASAGTRCKLEHPAQEIIVFVWIIFNTSLLILNFKNHFFPKNILLF